MNTPSTPVPKPVVFWMLWAGILFGVLMLHFLLHRPASTGVTAPDDPISYVPAGLFAAACVVRAVILPRITSLKRALVPFVIGLALADGSGILAMLLVPGPLGLFYFGLSVAAIVTYAPLFASRLEKEAEASVNTDS